MNETLSQKISKMTKIEKIVTLLLIALAVYAFGLIFSIITIDYLALLVLSGFELVIIALLTQNKKNKSKSELL